MQIEAAIRRFADPTVRDHDRVILIGGRFAKLGPVHTGRTRLMPRGGAGKRGLGCSVELRGIRRSRNVYPK